MWKTLEICKKCGLKNANCSTSTILKILTFLRGILNCNYLKFFLNFVSESDEKIARNTIIDSSLYKNQKHQSIAAITEINVA